MDREQKDILDNPGRGLGLMGDLEGESNWTNLTDPERCIVYLEKLENRRLYLMQPNLNYERTTDLYYGDQYWISFADFIRSLYISTRTRYHFLLSLCSLTIAK